MTVGYDKLSLRTGILLDLTFEEGAGAVTFDRAKPERVVDLAGGVSAWAQIVSGLNVLDLDGATDYLDCAAADTADLNFITGDYSIVGWINWSYIGTASIIIGRYGVDLDGWEVYLESQAGIEYLTLRHHHGSQVVDRTGCYSTGWDFNTWWLFGLTRKKSGATSYPLHYRNGAPVDVTWVAGGLDDPDTCNRDLVLGTRYTKDANWFDGQMQRPRIWGRELSAQDMLMIFEMERHRFGV